MGESAMTEIILIKEKDLVRDIIVEKLQENLPENTWNALDSTDFNALENKITSNLVIIDLNTKIDIIETIENFLENNVRAAVWTSEIDSPLLRELFRYGLHGYFFNGMELSELILATKMMLNDQQYIHPKLSTVLLNDYVKLTSKEPNRPAGILTEQEWNVLEEL